MATPRSNIVKLRLTDLEKRDWQEAAGGARQLSAWVRSICNAACENLRMDSANLTHSAIAALSEELDPGTVVAVDNLKPQVIEDAITREVQAQREARAPAQCDRWMHHRPGVYCGSCKQVVKK